MGFSHFLVMNWSTAETSLLFPSTDRGSQRRQPGGGPGGYAYDPGGDPLPPPPEGYPRAWAARTPIPAPRSRKRPFPGDPRETPKMGVLGPFSPISGKLGFSGPGGPSRLPGPLDPPGTAGPRREGLM